VSALLGACGVGQGQAVTFKCGFVDGEYQDGEIRGLAFLAGKRGMGKTTELVRLLKACSGGVVFFDTLSKHAHLLKGWRIVGKPGNLKEAIRANPNNFKIVYQPMFGDRAAHFEAVCAIVKAVGWCVFGVDEVDRHTTANIVELKLKTPSLHDLIEYGRHYRVAGLFTARKPSQVPRALTSECAEFRLFRTTENLYVRYWADTIGDTKTADSLRTLPKFHYLLCRDGEDVQVLSGGKLIKKF
jgi:hypothetical protein